jgi:Legume lectin domain
MKTALRGGFVAVALLIGIISGSQSLAAQSFSFPVGGFTPANVCANGGSPASSCQVLTNGSPNRPTLTTSGGLRLTTANTNQHGSAWFSLQQPLSTGFTTAFQFQISSTNSCYGCAFPADGMALVIQNDPAGTGALGYTGNGENLSYGSNDVSTASGPGNAITNSLAIELDTFQNTNYSDPNGNHIAVQSCGPNNASVLTPNSADHDYMCPNGNLAALALQSLPSGMSLSDGNVHTITVNYLPPGNCTSGCNNLAVYLDSTLILQTTLNIATQLNLTGNGSAYLGFTAATGSLVQNNDLVSWSFSSLPLAPITINQPLQTTTTTFNYTPTLSAIADYSQSGLGSGAFSGVFMQGTVQTITDQQFSDLVSNTPFQGTSCQHQDTGSGNYGCVITTDLCTTSASGTPSGANCPNTGTNALINVSNTYNLDPSQKPIIAPGYLMGTDTALSCGASANNTCKGLVNIFTSISGDAATSGGRTNNFNSTLIPILGAIQPSTAATTTPALNSSWTNAPIALNFNSTETVPPNNTNPPATLPAIASINYSATGANLPTPPTGTLTGTTGSIVIPNTSQGATVVTFFATDSAGTVESITTNSGGQVSSASPTITIQVDTIPPTVSCTPPAPAWQATDVIVACTAGDNAGGSGLVGPASFNVSTSVPTGTETNSATIAAVTVQDVAGNSSVPQGPFGPFELDKKAPVILGPTISPASPTFGQSVTANYSCTDGGSGVVLCGPAGTANTPATSNTGPLSSPASGTTGTHTVTINAQDAVGNQSVPSSVTYTVGQAAPTLTWSTPAAISYGTALSATQLNATASVAGAFNYAPGAGTVLSAGTHTLSVTFTPTDNTDYTSATATVLLVVNQRAPAISWATPAPIIYGTALSASQLNAASNVAGTFHYNPAAGTVLNAGTQILSATFTPADSTDYSTAVATVTLTVNKAASIISWATPAPITYGTLLSATQLDATANVPGTFVYAPPAGTELPAGSQTLAVTFTPTNTVDYTSATAQVTLQVTQPTIGLSPRSLNFGNVKLGNLEFLLETVSNPGSTPVKINGVSLKLGSGSDPFEFAFLSLCGPYLYPGKSCDIVVSFYADALGSHNATLLVTDNASGSPQQIPITVTVVKK